MNCLHESLENSTDPAGPRNYSLKGKGVDLKGEQPAIAPPFRCGADVVLSLIARGGTECVHFCSLQPGRKIKYKTAGMLTVAKVVRVYVCGWMDVSKFVVLIQPHCCLLLAIG